MRACAAVLLMLGFVVLPQGTSLAVEPAALPAAAIGWVQDASAPAAEPQPPQKREGLSLEEIQLSLKQAESSTEMDAGLKTKITELYTQAIQQLQLSSQCAAVAEELDHEREGAPQAMAAVQMELQSSIGSAPSLPPADATPAQLEQGLVQLTSELEAARMAEADLESLDARRDQRRLQIPRLLGEAKERLSRLIAEHPVEALGERVAPLASAQETLARAERQAIEIEIKRYEKELLAYAAQSDVLKSRREIAARRTKQLEHAVDVWRQAVLQHQRRDIEGAVDEAQARVAEAKVGNRALAEENFRLARERLDVHQNTDLIARAIRRQDEELAGLAQDYERIQKRVAAVGMTRGVGEMLRKDRARLPDLDPYVRELRLREATLGNVRLRMTELQEQHSSLTDAQATSRRAAAAGDTPPMAKVEAPPGVRPPDQVRTSEPDSAPEDPEAVAIARTQQALCADLLRDYASYFDQLESLNTKQREFITSVEQMAHYVESNVFWVASHGLPGWSDIRQAASATAWLFSPRTGMDLVRGAGSAVTHHVGGLLAVGVPLLVLLAMRGRLAAVITRSAERVGKPGKDSMLPTAKALAATMLRASVWPAVLALGGWTLSSTQRDHEIVTAIAAGLRVAAVLLATTGFVNELIRPGGLGERHFRWPAHGLAALRRDLRRLSAVLVPMGFLFSMLQALPEERGSGSLGRTAFVVACAAAGLLAHRVMRPGVGIVYEAFERRKDRWWYPLRRVAHAGLLAVPASLIVMATLGYYYTAHYLARCVLQTLWLGVGLVLINALLRRWILLQMQRRAVRAALARAAQTPRPASAGDTGLSMQVEEPQVDIADISGQTRQLVMASVGLAALFGLSLVWADVLPALRVLQETSLWTTTVEAAETVRAADGSSTVQTVARTVPVSLSDVGASVLIVVITVVLAKNIPGLLEVTVLGWLPIAASARYAFATMTRYLISVVGTVMAFGAIGISWAQVQWLVAAMTVGLGFGLQEIFANFVSGLIILIERPIRVGDAVTIGDTSGIVTRIRIRATTIATWDHKELVVPNKRFITSEVLNWTLSDPVIRLALPINIAHGSNADLVRDTLQRIAAAHPCVVTDPPPSAGFKGLSPGSMDFELSAYVRREEYGRVLHELNSAIEEALVAQGIGLATPIQLPQLQMRKTDGRPAQPVGA